MQVGARSVLLEGSLMEDYSVLQPGSVLPPTRRVPEGETTAAVVARPLHALPQAYQSLRRAYARTECSEITARLQQVMSASPPWSAGILPQSGALHAAESGRALCTVVSVWSGGLADPVVATAFCCAPQASCGVVCQPGSSVS